MKLASVIRRIPVLLLAFNLTAVGASRGDKKDSKPTTQTVDSGSFSVFVNGQHVATETFSIQQQNANSIIKSQLKGTGNDALQQSELEITANGELLHYDWSQSSGGNLTVQPKNEFLLEKISTASSSKPAEQPFLMPNTSAILDNNFFIHREVLAWRYLAVECKPDQGAMKCQHEPGDFGVLVPQDRTSMHVRMELVGKEKVKIRGAERELLRINMKGDTFDWVLWLDDQNQFKLMRVAIPADSTEVVRD